jgi:chloramphenicol O-acetyltransferase
MSRGYGTLALGAEYTPVSGLFIFFSPVTMKTTVVGYQPFANAGNFGVRPEYFEASGKRVAGNNILIEPGALLDLIYKKEVAKNISLQTKASFFWAYMRNAYDIDPVTKELIGQEYVFYKNVDVMWDFALVAKVTKYITASITTSLIYDDDIKVFRTKYANDQTNPKAYGPAIQFKQVLGLGVQATFKSKYSK